MDFHTDFDYVHVCVYRIYVYICNIYVLLYGYYITWGERESTLALFQTLCSLLRPQRKIPSNSQSSWGSGPQRGRALHVLFEWT